MRSYAHERLPLTTSQSENKENRRGESEVVGGGERGREREGGFIPNVSKKEPWRPKIGLGEVGVVHHPRVIFQTSRLLALLLTCLCKGWVGGFRDSEIRRVTVP